MTDGPKYLLDADVLMTAARSYDAFEVAPAFWDGLVREASNGRLLGIDRVEEEIQRGKDELVGWATPFTIRPINGVEGGPLHPLGTPAYSTSMA